MGLVHFGRYGLILTTEGATKSNIQEQLGTVATGKDKGTVQLVAVVNIPRGIYTIGRVHSPDS